MATYWGPVTVLANLHGRGIETVTYSAADGEPGVRRAKGCLAWLSPWACESEHLDTTVSGCPHTDCCSVCLSGRSRISGTHLVTLKSGCKACLRQTYASLAMSVEPNGAPEPTSSSHILRRHFFLLDFLTGAWAPLRAGATVCLVDCCDQGSLGDIC